MDFINIIVGDKSFLLFYPFYSIALLVITLIIIEIIDLMTLFRKSELQINDYEFMFLNNKFTYNNVVIYCLLTLYLHRYINIKKGVLTSTKMVVDTNSIKDTLLLEIYTRINSNDYTIVEIFNDEELKKIFIELAASIKKILINKYFLKTSKYKYCFLIFIPIIVPGLSQFFSCNNIVILLSEIILLPVIFSWVLYAYTYGPTRYGKRITNKHKRFLKKIIKNNLDDLSNDLILSYYGKDGIYVFKKTPELSVFFNELKDYYD